MSERGKDTERQSYRGERQNNQLLYSSKQDVSKNVRPRTTDVETLRKIVQGVKKHKEYLIINLRPN